MNPDEIKSLVVKLLLMALTPIATQLHIAGNNVTAVATDIADLIVLVYGIYSHWNMKKVPETATVVNKGTP